MTFSQDSSSDIVWITVHDSLPDTCCTCGMYSDKRVKVKHVDHKEVMVAGESGGVTLIRIVSLFLGPIGWLVSAMVTSNDEEKTKTIKETSKVRITQCLLCSGMGYPEVLDSMDSPKKFAFLTHPEFKRRFEQLKLEKLNKENQPDGWGNR